MGRRQAQSPGQGTVVLDGDSEERVAAGRHQVGGLLRQRGVGSDRRCRAQHAAPICLVRRSHAAEDGAPDIRHLWRVLQSDADAKTFTSKQRTKRVLQSANDPDASVQNSTDCQRACR